ncbi:Serine/threonine-protein kinase PrkC [Polystyrenella longa]|uniref:Serine/threonine-protein kinase PrkC n=1 Tax=Polystyrenella longa TaxID=2528007 RepID=A0A518CSF4_9PLAN|nr:serine/threonine-protein kinase [Polystyrenella longa]QDU82162.1 Serine/threonine-protein kinase PrkC [Polystyrenella longa]
MLSYLFSRNTKETFTPPPGFDLIESVGRGTFTELWKLRGRDSQKDYVLKQLRTEWLNDYSARQFLENEAQVAVQIDSPHLPKLVHSELKEKHPYLIFEWFPGVSLEERLSTSKPLNAGEAVWITRQIVDALGELEAAGFAHGDLKPENILIDEFKQIRLIDLAFARKLSDHDVINAHTTLMDEPEYLAPEALTRSRTNPLLQDIYAIGVLFYRMLTGRLPFYAQGETSFEDVLQQQRESLPPTLRRFCPLATVEMVDLSNRLLAKQPLRRPQSTGELARELIDIELSTMSTRFSVA